MTQIVDAYIQLGLLGTIGVVFIWLFIRQNNQNAILIEQFRKQIETQDKIYDALKPLTSLQALNLFGLIFRLLPIDTYNMMCDILLKNNIHEHESLTLESINGSLKTMHMQYSNILRCHKYSGTTLDTFFYDWTPEISKALYEELYTHKTPQSKEMIKKNIETVFLMIKNTIETEISKT